MNKTKTTTKPLLLLALGILCLSTAAHARNDLLRMPLAEALGSPDAAAKLNPHIRLYFGTQKYGEPLKRLGTFPSTRKTNFFNKSDKQGCEWAFLSVALALQDKAAQLGGNAVVNIVSNSHNVEFSSESEYECTAGNVSGGVALRGEVVLLR